MDTRVENARGGSHAMIDVSNPSPADRVADVDRDILRCEEKISNLRVHCHRRWNLRDRRNCHHARRRAVQAAGSEVAADFAGGERAIVDADFVDLSCEIALRLVRVACSNSKLAIAYR